MEDGIYAETSSEDDTLTDSSLDEDSDNVSTGSDFRSRVKYRCGNISIPVNEIENHEYNLNLVKKLRHRELNGNSCGQSHHQYWSRAFSKVPKRMGFCLKDIIPNCYLQGHMFMGLSACGQFMLSYKVCSNENASNLYYAFNIGYKYTLYFWVFQPHKPFRRYFKTCLFDDHGVDNLKEVSMTQWKTTQRQVLIVHGAAENENEDSYITYVKVPKLGCLDCKKLHECEEDGFSRCDALCLKCNLTVHTKYSTTETDPTFKPHVNLLCPERIIIVANGFVHMLHIELESSRSNTASAVQQSQVASPSPSHHNLSHLHNYQNTTKATTSIESDRQFIEATDRQAVDQPIGCDNKNNIVARIIADFSDFETDSSHSSFSNTHSETCSNGIGNHSTFHRKSYDELIFTCQGNSNFSRSGNSKLSSTTTITSSGNAPAKVNFSKHRSGRHNHRIVTKSYRNGVITVDLQARPTSGTGSTIAPVNADKSNTYEFSEDNEKCEKIATFRKRRLAEKKYEFSEDNSENIVPFTKVRSATRNSLSSSSLAGCSLSSARSLHRAAGSSQFNYFSSPSASPSSSPRSHSTLGSGYNNESRSTASMHRLSPLGMGFRSSPTCTSPISSGMMRSPSRHMTSTASLCQQQKSPTLSQATQQMLSFKHLTTLSPLQVSIAKRSHFESLGGHMSPNANVPFLSPRREEYKVVEVPLQGGLALEKPVCTKKFKRRYVEEDEAASVITSEEDDCISPGYHTSLPVEVHGSCYSEMQMISQASYQQLRHCASVVITQHSFDLETFSYYVTSKLCQKHNKIYDVFNDWAYELISVCPHSNNIVCMLIVQFVVRDLQPFTKSSCSLSCNPTSNVGCSQHRKPCECRILFTWNMDSGDWEVLDYGDLTETAPNFDELPPLVQKCGRGFSLAKAAKNLARDLKSSLSKMQDYSQNLRVLDSNVNKSKTTITDFDNIVEFYLRRPRCQE